ncbi:efflux pump protein [Paraphoma chrysanthemicola]|uniref:Efflux pump protein n=1 Tax=Paraphoma chrysanthemicola TaxID=798071 RepID=A0A8K0RBH0_9PLEO|nr:efflux pump protein [Paraphoma chrysanthemicola]
MSSTPQDATSNHQRDLSDRHTTSKPEPTTPLNDNEATKDGQDPNSIKGLKLIALLSGLTLINFLALLDTSIIGTAIPYITTTFHSLPDVGWYVSAYTLSSAVLQPLSGKLYTHFPIKATFLSFIFLFELGSLICGVAPSSAALIVGRAIAGMGVSGLMLGGMTIITRSVEKSKSPMYLGIILGVSQMGVVVAPLIGGGLTEHVSWRWCFYINLPIGGLAAALFVFIHIPEVATKEPFSMALVQKVIPELDLFGFALFVPPAIMFLLALQFGSGNTFAWNSATIIGLFVGAAVLAAMFIAWEIKMGDRAMLPGSLLKQRRVWSSCVYAISNICCMITASNWLPTYFQAVKGDGPTMSGVHVLPSILSQLMFVILSGFLVSKLGFYLPWAFGGGIIMAIGNGLVSTFKASTTTGEWIGFQIVVGVGRGAGVQMPLIAVQNAVSPAQVPIAMSFLIFFQNLGTSIGIVIANTIFAQNLSKAASRYAPSVSSHAALNAGSGAGAVRALVAGHEEELGGLLRAYSESLRNVFFFLVALSGVAVLASLGMGWVDVRKKDEKYMGAEETSSNLTEGKAG